MIQTSAERPEKLTGTNGEPALHFHPVRVHVQSPTHETILGNRPVEVFITSESLLLYCSETSTLATIEYPDIVLHAASSDPAALYLQIENDVLASQLLCDDNWRSGMFELFLKPISSTDQVNDMFTALSTCASMHPDPASKDDVSNDAEMTFAQQMSDPNHQWITADAAHGRFEDAEEVQIQSNGHGEGEEETDGPRKWRRTS